ncbi:b3 domain-containing transcription factor vrn1, partial [Quercus suber]
MESMQSSTRSTTSALAFSIEASISSMVSHCSCVHTSRWLQKIIEKFVKEFGDELSNVATQTLPYGGIWQAGLEKSDKEYFGFVMVRMIFFIYEGNSNFHVLVFDKTATEIQLDLINLHYGKFSLTLPK